ncbi:phage holin family protein [Bifidobacterium sp.]|uniref:phage holin family protein n=1 Tax=Bifidobacterium sp. TaxID=41200 RepID=UPI0025C05EFC|nr:phage holin family protein [Bifidobacterium sp.]MCH4208613.1 phage holin family protein [Bifidobacterium sp.]MCI1224299.1 phage holin family protein [Bifidobacterium sp.]
MTRFLARWLVMTIAVAVTVLILPGMHTVGDPPIFGFAAFALFMALINASIKPIVHVLALPLSIVSFGLAALIINWIFMRFASWLAIGIFGVGVDVGGFWWSVLASIIMSIVSGIAAAVVGND